ncbi:MAG: histidinol dehydrogenase [Pseudomonadales bacterium]
MEIRRLDSTRDDFDTQLNELLAWDISADSEIEQVVRGVIADIQQRGDVALLEYTAQFDGVEVAAAAELEISQQALRDALERIGVDERRALQAAAERIRDYHEHQLQSSWSYQDDLGNQLGQRITPLERVGVYVPGGQASYPSSVLMTLVPARVAGVGELVVTVPTPGGVRNDMVLAALAIAGADRVFSIGGAQAVAALAYGTDTVPRVDKIVGPGGAYVAAAKRLVYGQVGIDLIAGPSEICVVADAHADPELLAWDLFSQAEHDAAAQSILISPQASVLEAVYTTMARLLPDLKRTAIVAESLARRGALIKVLDLAEAMTVVNRIAPEHLELNVADPDSWLDAVKHAGAIFCGPYTGETFGDYVAGPSHVLPTFGTARFASPLGVYDFQKRSSVIHMSAAGAASLADIAVPLATSEGLEAHARAAAIRVKQDN